GGVLMGTSRLWLIVSLVLTAGLLLAHAALSAPASAPLSPSLDWDARLDSLHVRYQPAADCATGCWRLVSARYENEHESGGWHHVFAKALGADGRQLAGVQWYLAYPTGRDSGYTKSNAEWAEIAMYEPGGCFDATAGGGPYRAFAGEDERRSDSVHGLGLPACYHVNFRLTWQWLDGAALVSPTPASPRVRAFLPLLANDRDTDRVVPPSPTPTSTPGTRPTATPIETMPEIRVYDLSGQRRDLAWVASVYGAVIERSPADGGSPVWRVVEIHEREGPAVQLVKTLDGDGNPQAGVPVVRHWPGAPPLPSTPASPWRREGVIGETNADGDVGFGLGRGDYITGPGQGVSAVWVAHPTQRSDLADKLGMIAGTNHRRLDFVFRLMGGNPPAPAPTATPAPGSTAVPSRPYSGSMQRWEANCAGTQVKGRVTDRAGTPLSGVSVRVLTYGDQHGSPPVTDGNGFYQFNRFGSDDPLLEIDYWVTVVDGSSGAELSNTVRAFTNRTDCAPGGSGHQVAVIDFVRSN
ncbi:MAG TPA: carboxypeptidase-like regulatory domain-containing protein, partial [Ardenticatenaceae bacterium]|nr:carboxypeptidase-like regulatory domain-containing protein [Ardenticatenaceae bacterium]